MTPNEAADQTAQDFAGSTRNTLVNWTGNKFDLRAALNEANRKHTLPKALVDQAKRRLENLPDKFFRLTITGSKVAAKTWEIEVHEIDTPSAG